MTPEAPATRLLRTAAAYAAAWLLAWALVPGIGAYEATMGLYAWVPARTAYVLWRNRTPLAWGQFTLGAVFGFCAYVGYSPGAAGLIDHDHAGAHLLLNVVVAAFIVYDGWRDYFGSGARAEGERDAAREQLTEARERGRHAEIMEYVLQMDGCMFVRAEGHGDHDPVWVAIGKGFADALGYTREHFVGRTVGACIHPDDLAATAAAAEARGRGEDVSGFRNRYRFNPDADPTGHVLLRDSRGLWKVFDWSTDPDPDGWVLPRDVTAETLVTKQRDDAREERDASNTRARVAERENHALLNLRALAGAAAAGAAAESE